MQSLSNNNNSWISKLSYCYFSFLQKAWKEWISCTPFLQPKNPSLEKNHLILSVLVKDIPKNFDMVHYQKLFFESADYFLHSSRVDFY